MAPGSGILIAAARLKRAVIEARKNRDKARIAKKHLPGLRDFFQQQRDQVLEKFADLEHLYADIEQIPASVRTNKAAPQQTVLNQWGKAWAAVEKSTTSDLQNLVTAAEMDGVKAGGDYLAKTINPDGKFWDLSNPRAVKWFQEKGGSINYIKDIQKTTRESLQSLIVTSLNEGWSYNQTAKEIRKLYDGPISMDRAKRIAVFESGQAYEAGNNLFAKSLQDDGVEMQQMWMTSHDDKVRPEHAANEAEGWVPLGHVFSSGDTEPPTDPGCRCYMIYRQKPAGDGD